MIAHSFRGAIFGPAQNLHGATYEVTAEFHRADLDPDGLVVDIGLATRVLREILDGFDYRNLDDLADFEGANTTTEFMAATIHTRLAAAARDGRLGAQAGGLAGLRVQLDESPRAWASFEGPLA